MAGSKTDVNRSAQKRPWILRWGFLALPIGVVLGLVALFVNGVYLTFRSAAWTLTYRELAAD